MPTVTNRLHRHKITHLTQLQRRELGLIIAQAYQLTPIKKNIYRRLSKEKEGTFNVLDYPPEFNNRMDELISEYITYHPKPKERKRIPTKTPLYSTRNYPKKDQNG